MDDEKELRELVAELVTHLGFEAALAGDGAAAVEAYRRAMEADRVFDAVILDLSVRSGMGGVEALEQLRRIDPEVRAVAVSGYVTDPVLADPHRHGFAAAVAKPFILAELAEALRRAMTPGE